MYLLRRLAFVSALVLAVGCGGKAVIDGDAGAGGTTSTGVSTGITATNSTSATSTTTGPQSCQSLADCGAQEFCDFPDGQVCSGFGTCTPRPNGCTADCPGVCGCDTQFYCNACEAQAAGTDAPGPCVGQSIQEAHAEYLPTGVERIGVAVWDNPTASCVFYFLQGGGPPAQNTTISATNDWEAAGVAELEDLTRDECLAWAPSDSSTVSSSGTISLFDPDGQPGSPVCYLNLDTVVALAQGAISHTLTNVTVIGGPCNVPE